MNFSNFFKNEPSREPFQAGETLVSRGARNDKMFVILEGELEVHLEGTRIATLKEGDIFGELSLIDKEPASGDVVAVKPGHYVSIDEPRFLQILQVHPLFGLALLRALSAKLRATNANLRSSDKY